MERGGNRGNQYTGGKGSNDPFPNDQLTIEQAADLMNVSAPTVKRAKARIMSLSVRFAGLTSTRAGVRSADTDETTGPELQNTDETAPEPSETR